MDFSMSNLIFHMWQYNGTDQYMKNGQEEVHKKQRSYCLQSFHAEMIELLT
jgi:hypothetical protein